MQNLGVSSSFGDQSQSYRQMHYRLTPLQRKVLSVIQHQGDLPITEVADLVATKVNNVRYAITMLHENGIIYNSPLIDLTKLGYTYHTVAFSIFADDLSCPDEVREYLSKAPHVVTYYETGGQFQFCAIIASRFSDGIDQFLCDIEKNVGFVIKEKQIASHLHAHDYRCDYLFSESYGERALSWGKSNKFERIDQVDHKILRCISEIASFSYAEVARQLAIPLSTAEYRIKKLEKLGVIAGFRTIIRTEKLGAHRFWLPIVARGSSSALTELFNQYCNNNPFVRFTTRTIGAWDFEVSFDAPNAHGVALVVQNFNETFKNKIFSAHPIPVFRYGSIRAYPFYELTTEPK